MNKCEGCIFRALWFNTPICKRETTFNDQTRAAMEKPPCRLHITRQQVAELQETANRQKDEIETQKCVIHLLEEDIADRDKMLESKVEEVYAEFMRDYKAMREELEGCCEEMATTRAEKDNLIRTYAECQADVVKEFSESLKKHARSMCTHDISGENWMQAVPVETIDKAVKKLIERGKPHEIRANDSE